LVTERLTLQSAIGTREAMFEAGTACESVFEAGAACESVKFDGAGESGT